jgi:hypothetical protein
MYMRRQRQLHFRVAVPAHAQSHSVRGWVGGGIAAPAAAAAHNAAMSQCARGAKLNDPEDVLCGKARDAHARPDAER